VPGEPSNFLGSLNSELARRLPTYVHINDVEALAAQHGVLNWFDARFWHHAKQPVSFQCLVPLVQNIAQIIGALFGRSAKCVVVDLDNTLWGGVVGDDGPDGLLIGEGTGIGEAYTEFQRYLLRLKERGVLLAVCSKNEPENARVPFQIRPEMVLKEEDFSAFIANWQPKSMNLLAIAEQLNIGTDALVFVDDNPAEREEIRQALPEVRVVELSSDPADYPRQLDQTGWLEILSISSEDRQRSRLYQQDRERQELRESTGDYASYLKSLDQRAVIASFDERHLERITQLTNKTNQFNLTTRRMSSSEIEAVMRSNDYLTAYVRLSDRFGDNGLVSLLVGNRRDTELLIDLWLMSCRVFGRGVEQLLCNYIVDQARGGGIRTLRGRYIPTERNGLVREHYPSMGFTAADGGDGEGEHWELDIAAYQPFDTPIVVVDDY
jgi:FkbH-like protein